MTDIFDSVRGKSEPAYAEIQAVVQRVLEDAPKDRQLRHAAYSAARGLDEAMLRKLAADHLVSLAKMSRRAQVLRIENEAARDRAAVMHEKPTGRRPQRGTAAHRRWLAASPENEAYEDRLAMAEIDAFAGLMSGLQQSLTKYTAAMRMEWTQELLGSEFALPNGQRVTWGEATAEQHATRLAMFMDKAAANLEGAARHRKALDELEKMGAANLNALVGVTA